VIIINGTDYKELSLVEHDSPTSTVTTVLIYEGCHYDTFIAALEAKSPVIVNGKKHKIAGVTPVLNDRFSVYLTLWRIK